LRRDLAMAKAGLSKRDINPDDFKNLPTDKASVDFIVAMNKSKQFDIADFKPDPTYQVGIDLQAALKNPGSSADIVLRDGDIISVPQQISTVKVSGAVAYPTAVAFKKKRAKYYINNAGGYSQDARRKPYVVYMNGSVMPACGAKVEPGCEVVVPTKVFDPNKIATATATIGMLSSISSVAMLAVTVIVMLKR